MLTFIRSLFEINSRNKNKISKMMDTTLNNPLLRVEDAMGKIAGKVGVIHELCKDITLKDMMQLDLAQDELFMVNELIKKFKLLNERLCTITTDDLLNAIEDINLTTDITKEKLIVLTDGTRSRKLSLYLAKLKLCTKHYINANEKLSMELKTLKGHYSKSQVSTSVFILKEDLSILQAKVNRYENELTKMEQGYCRLKKSKLRVPAIITQVQVLNLLRQEHSDLETEIKRLKDSQSDMDEANSELLPVVDGKPQDEQDTYSHN